MAEVIRISRGRRFVERLLGSLLYVEIAFLVALAVTLGPFWIIALLLDRRSKREQFDDDFGAYFYLLLMVVPVTLWIFVAIMFVKGKMG